MQRNYYIMRRSLFQAMPANIVKGCASMMIRKLSGKPFGLLPALRIGREGDGPNFELITRGNLLSSLLENLIAREVGQ